VTGLPSRAANERLVDDAMTAAHAVADVDGPLPERARVVVVGGGIIGASVLRHLVASGITDAVLLERHRLTSGTSWHPAGLFATTRATHGLTELARHSAAVYRDLTAHTGIENGFNPRGCLVVARRPERVTELAYGAAMARHHGVTAHVLEPGEIARHHLLIDAAGLTGGVLYPGDGTVNPGASALALVKLAADGGAQVREGVTVEGITTRDGRVGAVETTRGRIACETVVVCAGLWSAELLRRTGVPLALHAAEHVWAMTEPVESPVWDQPFIRDLDGHVYVRGYRDRLLVGAFEPRGKPRPLTTIREPFAFGEFEPDLQHVEPSLERARERVPVLRRLQIERHLNAPESFTPDNLPIVGETPEVGGLFVAAGMNSQGILLGPGVGRAVAEWIAEGAPTMDIAELAPGRFGAAQAGARYLAERTRESLGRLYAMHWPDLQPETARGLRRTPLHDRLAAAGACFGEVAGWERANWYGEPGERPQYVYSFERPPYFERVAAEHRAAREAVALFDLSSFAKIEVAGPGALAAVQHVFASDLDVQVGNVVYTTMLNARGGVDLDLTISRLALDRFLAVGPAISQRALIGRLRAHAGAAVVTDVTATRATLGVMGPRSRELLTRLTDARLDSDAFPFGTVRTIDVDGVPVLAIRLSFVGELGWELYPPADSAVALHDAICEAGADLGLRHAGYHALDTLRLEKGYRHWPLDVGPVDSPLDAGLGFTVSWDKPCFIGRDAVLALRDSPRRRRMVHVRLTEPEPLLRHGETVLWNGRVAGRVTSGAYGHHLGTSVGLAALEDRELLALGDDLFAERVTVDIAGVQTTAELSRRPFFDPDNQRLCS
jgi:glycine cleavage system aminomethyltransferase T/glycine/D-amino acid oxidase-like deaminating enzyme